MNCYNHPEKAAVATCSQCGKGLCADCANTYSITICTSCNLKTYNSRITYQALSLLLYVLAFYLGYTYLSGDFKPLHSGYLAMSLVAGWRFLNKVSFLQLTVASLPMWIILWVLKLLLSVVTGFFLSSFIILWSIFKLVQDWIRLREIRRDVSDMQ